MVRRRELCLIILGVFFCVAAASAQGIGSIRGVIYDKDFDVPLGAAEVSIVETGQKVKSTDEGHFVFSQVLPGMYTLVFSKEGYIRLVKADVAVSAGQLTEVDVSLSGEFTEMDELVVQDLKIGGGTEAGLLTLRLESPALLDSISADLMSRAGASDAAAALNLVSGATVQDGKFAVIRGLPDRYVNSQMNGVRLPSADADTRAVELDQFPSVVIESIQVSKTFTPDQQGDASGGAVNLVIKGIPDETALQLSSQVSYNTQVTGRDDFLTYKGGGVDFLGIDDGGRDIFEPGFDNDDTVGVSRGDAPIDYKWSLAGGGKHEFENGIKVGGLASVFYERDSSFYDNGIDDSYWELGTDADKNLEPKTDPGITTRGEDFDSFLFDKTEGSEEVKWGGLGVVGVEFEDYAKLKFLYLYTRAAEDTATLLENTRGKAFFYPTYDPNDPSTEGHEHPGTSPYLRLETLRYTERATQTMQLNGEHTVPIPNWGIENLFEFLSPKVDWTLARSSADSEEPDKRQFGSRWIPLGGGIHNVYKPSANFSFGNLQRIWKEIAEDSEQFFVNVKFPFRQWSGDEGYLKFGVFRDRVDRSYDQESLGNFGDQSTFPARPFVDPGHPFDEFWSAVFPSETHVITDGPPFIDVDYEGDQKIFAWYHMMDLPLTSYLNLIAGFRYESTDIGIVNFPDSKSFIPSENRYSIEWIIPGPGRLTTPFRPDDDRPNPDFSQDDVLPAIGVVVTPVKEVTLRASYSETVARQTFKELSPILQQEYLGGDVFVGNPFLEMSALKNYDLRADYAPYEGGLVSISYFVKSVRNPIEYVSRITGTGGGFTYITPVNYPKGTLSGFEFEVRQELGHFWEPLKGLAVGANATLIDSEVRILEEEVTALVGAGFPMKTRDMTNAPEYLYNINLTYDYEPTATQFAVFYTVRGDTLVTGAEVSRGNFVPNVYETEYATLNLSVTQKIGKHFKVRFQAKNLTDPKIEEVYRSEFTGPDLVKTSYSKGIELSLSVGAEFTF